MRDLHLLDDQRLVRTFIGEVEALRLKRRAQWHDRPHPEGKLFTQEELCDLAYPSYKNLLKGRTARLPSRSALLNIAEYLECNVYEGNDLLQAAQYLPEQVEMREDQYLAARERARLLMHILPLPTVLVSRGWHSEDANPAFYELTRLPRFHTLPVNQRTCLQVIFNPELPLRTIWTPDQEIWLANARSAIRLFQSIHQPFRREAWYQNLVQDLHRLPDFATYWRESEAGAGSAEPDTFDKTCFDGRFAIPYQDRSFTITFGAAPFPQLIVGIPIDDGARHIYDQLGCETNENRWEHMLTDCSTSL